MLGSRFFGAAPVYRLLAKRWVERLAERGCRGSELAEWVGAVKSAIFLLFELGCFDGELDRLGFGDGSKVMMFLDVACWTGRCWADVARLDVDCDMVWAAEHDATLWVQRGRHDMKCVR